MSAWNSTYQTLSRIILVLALALVFPGICLAADGGEPDTQVPVSLVVPTTILAPEGCEGDAAAPLTSVQAQPMALLDQIQATSCREHWFVVGCCSKSWGQAVLLGLFRRFDCNEEIWYDTGQRDCTSYPC
jgi:hypothetical protein